MTQVGSLENPVQFNSICELTTGITGRGVGADGTL
jgi:hypothetical protein